MQRRVAVLIAELEELEPSEGRLSWLETADVIAASRWGVAVWEELLEPELDELHEELLQRGFRARLLEVAAA